MASCVASGEVPIIDGKMRRSPPSDLSGGGEAIGFAISVGWSPSLRDMIGFAHLPTSRSPDDAVALRWEQDGEAIEAFIALSQLPFVKPTRR